MKSLYNYPVDKLGPNEISDGDCDDIYGAFNRVIYWYAEIGLGGGGIAIGRDEEGTLSVMELKHNEQHGPTEYWALNAFSGIDAEEAERMVLFSIPLESLNSRQETECRRAISNAISSL